MFEYERGRLIWKEKIAEEERRIGGQEVAIDNPEFFRYDAFFPRSCVIAPSRRGETGCIQSRG